MSFPYIEHVVLLQKADVSWAARARWRGSSVWRAQQHGEPLAACASLLEQAPRGRAPFLDRATVLLGFPHVHYLMLPWQDGMHRMEDWQAFAETAFSQQADLDPTHWHVHVARHDFGQACLAVAISRELLSDLRALFKLKTLPLVTCTPLLSAVARQYWAQLPADCVLAVPEPGALSCLYVQDASARQVCAMATSSPLSDSLFAAAMLVEHHADETRVISNDPTHEHWLGPLHPWLLESLP